MTGPLIVQYYLFRNLDALREKDPGVFPFHVAAALQREWPDAKVLIVDGFGPVNFVRALAVMWRTRRAPQVAIQFHLNLRTLCFAVLSRLVQPRQKLIVKADATPGAPPSSKARAIWRLIDRLAHLIVCETPEALELAAAAGLGRAEFVPNAIGDFTSEAPPRSLDRLRYDFLFITREGDDRKSPALCERVAGKLATRGFSVACVGLRPRPQASMTCFESVSRGELARLLAESWIYVGLSRSESYWFVAAEAAALGVPESLTATGIAPYLSRCYAGCVLLDDPDRHTDDGLADQLIARRLQTAHQFTPFHIDVEARARLESAVARRLCLTA